MAGMTLTASSFAVMQRVLADHGGQVLDFPSLATLLADPVLEAGFTTHAPELPAVVQALVELWRAELLPALVCGRVPVTIASRLTAATEKLIACCRSSSLAPAATLQQLCDELERLQNRTFLKRAALFAVPERVTVADAQRAQSALQSGRRAAVTADAYFPEVMISYTNGSRAGVDDPGTGPGMLHAATVAEALAGDAIPVFTGMHVLPGEHWRKAFMARLDREAHPATGH